MKRISFLPLLLLFSLNVVSQNSMPDSSAALDLISTPNSPGFTILGIAPQEIEQPQTPTDFALNVLNSTQYFSSLPENYSLELAPAWIFFGKHISYRSFSENNPASNIAQTLTISVATATNTPLVGTQMGTGFRFSILRGKIDAEFNDYQKKIEEGFAALDSFNKHSSEMIIERSNNDPIILQNEQMMREAQARGDLEAVRAYLSIIDAEQRKIAEEVEEELSSEIEDLKSRANDIQVRRIGFKWDFAGATALDFKDNNFTDSYLTNTGFWTPLGYETNSNFSVLATGRVLFQHSNSATNDVGMTNIDGGLRLLYDKGKFSFSGEALYRQSIVKDGDNEKQWKYDVNAAYNFLPNKTLTFSLGKNFDQLNTEFNGNLIAWLNVLIGLGAKRKVI